MQPWRWHLATVPGTQRQRPLKTQIGLHFPSKTAFQLTIVQHWLLALPWSWLLGILCQKEDHKKSQDCLNLWQGLNSCLDVEEPQCALHSIHFIGY